MAREDKGGAPHAAQVLQRGQEFGGGRAKTRIAIPGVARRQGERPRAAAWRKRHAAARGTRIAPSPDIVPSAPGAAGRARSGAARGLAGPRGMPATRARGRARPEGPAAPRPCRWQATPTLPPANGHPILRSARRRVSCRLQMLRPLTHDHLARRRERRGRREGEFEREFCLLQGIAEGTYNTKRAEAARLYYTTTNIHTYTPTEL